MRPSRDHGDVYGMVLAIASSNYNCILETDMVLKVQRAGDQAKALKDIEFPEALSLENATPLVARPMLPHCILNACIGVPSNQHHVAGQSFDDAD